MNTFLFIQKALAEYPNSRAAGHIKSLMQSPTHARKMLALQLYLQGLTYTEVGKKIPRHVDKGTLGISRERTRILVAEALGVIQQRLRAAFGKEELANMFDQYINGIREAR